MIKYVLLKRNTKTISNLETMRLNVFNFPPYMSDKYFKYNIKHRNFLVYGLIIDNKLVGAAYISDRYNSLYIEEIFIDKKYQNRGLGKSLLMYILKENQYISKYYKKELEVSKLEYTNENNKRLYNLLGYKDDHHVLVKRLSK